MSFKGVFTSTLPACSFIRYPWSPSLRPTRSTRSFWAEVDTGGRRCGRCEWSIHLDWQWVLESLLAGTSRFHKRHLFFLKLRNSCWDETHNLDVISITSLSRQVITHSEQRQSQQSLKASGTLTRVGVEGLGELAVCPTVCPTQPGFSPFPSALRPLHRRSFSHTFHTYTLLSCSGYYCPISYLAGFQWLIKHSPSLVFSLLYSHSTLATKPACTGVSAVVLCALFMATSSVPDYILAAQLMLKLN